MATTQNALLLAIKQEHGVAACGCALTDPKSRAQQFYFLEMGIHSTESKSLAAGLA
jgi:uncharacterized protein YunC (DUF1805 family)